MTDPTVVNSFGRGNDGDAGDPSRPIYPISSAPTVAAERWPSAGYILLWTIDRISCSRWRLGAWTGNAWVRDDGTGITPQFWAPIPGAPPAAVPG